MFSTSRQWFARRPTALTDQALQTRTDTDLAYRLFEIFERDLSLAGIRGVHFYVQEGTVTLYGALPHALDRDLLVSFVRNIDGVVDVVEHLQLIPRRAPDHPAEHLPLLPQHLTFTPPPSADS